MKNKSELGESANGRERSEVGSGSNKNWNGPDLHISPTWSVVFRTGVGEGAGPVAGRAQ